jgi:hypothetical protein
MADPISCPAAALAPRVGIIKVASGERVLAIHMSNTPFFVRNARRIGHWSSVFIPHPLLTTFLPAPINNAFE